MNRKGTRRGVKSVVNKRRRKRKRKTEQLTIFRTMHGGPRPRAGRPKSNDSGVAHARRERVNRDDVLLVTTKALAGLPSLRSEHDYRTILEFFARGCEKDCFRLVEFSIQKDHVNLVCEAKDRTSLSRGIQGLSIRIARR